MKYSQIITVNLWIAIFEEDERTEAKEPGVVQTPGSLYLILVSRRPWVDQLFNLLRKNHHSPRLPTN
jgi:hypothetical protein